MSAEPAHMGGCGGGGTQRPGPEQDGGTWMGSRVLGTLGVRCIVI